jgi:hypothetical protein
MLKLRVAGVMSLTLAATACVQAPTSPSVLALPSPGKPFAQFQEEDASCKGYAQQQTAGLAQSANNNAVGAAVLGTALGAAGGALIGSPFRGGAGVGAGIGAGTGLAVGSSIGAGQSAAANYTIQQRFDIAYTQCMYANGNSVQGAPAPGIPPGVPYPYGYPGYPAPYPTY